MMDWGLTEEESDLAEYVYYVTKGSIYVDADGNLHEFEKDACEKIDSTQSYAFDIFIGEIENAKMRAERSSKNQ